MHVTLVVPGLLDWPPSALAAVDDTAPALARLLASAPEPVIDADGLVAAACRACGIAKQQDWPVAPWLASGAGIDPEDAYWLCADPVRFFVSHNDIRLAGLVDDLETDDATELIAVLNAHFAEDGIVFFAPKPARWLVRADHPPRLTTRPPEIAVGAPLLPFLATGADAAPWRRWQSELQMLLFEHPVNRRREENGRAPVDGIWLWGGGTLASRGPSAERIFANNGLPAELARSAGVPLRPLPERFDASEAGESVFWLDPLGVDADAARLAALDRSWTAPVERAMRAGGVNEIELVVSGRASALTFRSPRPSLKQRWRARLSPQRVAPRLARLAADAGSV
jgi:hypothetical protein